MRVIALEYHDVLAGPEFDGSGFPGAAANSYKLALEDFTAHLDVLRRREGVGTSVHALDAGKGPRVLLTFDDGGVSAVAVTAPLLESRGYMGHFFVSTSTLGTSGFCGPDALRELGNRGHVVGSHSHSHPMRMGLLSDRELDREWGQSCGVLAEVLHARVTVASVPGGYHSRRVARAAARAGIRFLFTSEPLATVGSVDGCRVLGRFTPRRGSAPAEVASLVGALGLARARQWALWNAKKLVKAVAGDAYLNLRRALLGEREPPVATSPGSAEGGPAPPARHDD